MNAEKPAPKMRSSIACARCRRSKVKCINNGVNTPCRACEATGRECTYPPPATPGSRSSASGSAGTTGPTQYSMQGSPNVGGGTVGWNSAASLGNGSLAAEKPRRPKRPSAHSASGSQAHLIPKDGSVRPFSEALDPNVLTPAVWSQTYDLLTLHYPHLPILHRPTFLRPLTEAPSLGQSAATSTPPPNSTSSTPPPAPSPFLLLAILTLVGRFSPALVAHHSTTPINTSEYYAHALRSRLLSISSSDDPEEDGILVPSIPKIQSLIMLGVHELGQSNGDRAWIWLGVAIRMCQLLDLPPSSDTQGKSLIEVESERRTWWAVVMLDRMLSSSGGGKGRAFAFGWERVRNVALPCTERAWLFGDRVRVSSLMPPITTISTGTSAPNNGTHNEDVPDETGANESVHSRLIRLVDVWGRVCQFLCNPETSTSSHETLIAELERWKDDLPRSLSYTHQNLQAHISAHTSSAYALLHILYYLCILLLHRESLPASPTTSSPEAPNECFSAARKITEIAREMNTWLSLPLTPVVCFAVYCTAWVGTYGLHHPHMRGPPGNAMGAGDTNFLLYIIEGWRPKWRTADGWLRALASLHAFLGFRRRTGELGANRKRRWDEEASEGMDIDSPGLGDDVSDEMRSFDKALRDFFSLSTRKEQPRQAKKPRSNIASSVGGDSDTEMGNIAAETAAGPDSSAASGADRWVAVNTSAQRQEPDAGLQGLIAATQHAAAQQPEPVSQQISPTSGDAPSNAVATGQPQQAPRDEETLGKLDKPSAGATENVERPLQPPQDALNHVTKTEKAEPVTPTTAAPPKTESSADSVEPQDRERFLFEGWGKRGVARIDLTGFAEGKRWQEWAEGDENWFGTGTELLSLTVGSD